MRRPEDDHLDPEVDRALAVIDATLAGEAVEPEDAELAEMTLILAGQRPIPSPEFIDALDTRVAARFSGPSRRSSAAAAAPSRGRKHRRWLWAPGAMAGVAAAVALAVVLPSLNGNSGPRHVVQDLSAGTSSSAGSGASSSGSSTAASASAPTLNRLSKAPSGTQRRLAPGPATPAGKQAFSGSNGSASAASSAGTSSNGAVGGANGASIPAVSPGGSGRQVIQSAQLALSTRPDQVDAVSQQVFDVIAAQKGYVQSSTVTATGGATGYAQFQLSVPSPNLQATMTALSRLHGAAVVSRTDNSQDVTADLGGAGRRLADARALRTSLLRRLAAATTTTAIDSLKAQIRDAEASIASDLATLNGLHRRVDNTQISVTLNASMRPGHRRSGATGFTLHKAAHDAGRVLVVAAGVALIALAVLTPLALLAAIGVWVGAAVRRRRREQALDLV